MLIIGTRVAVAASQSCAQVHRSVCMILILGCRPSPVLLSTRVSDLVLTSAGTPTSHRRARLPTSNNAHALENGLLWMTVVPLVLKFIIYGVRTSAHMRDNGNTLLLRSCFAPQEPSTYKAFCQEACPLCIHASLQPGDRAWQLCRLHAAAACTRGVSKQKRRSCFGRAGSVLDAAKGPRGGGGDVRPQRRRRKAATRTARRTRKPRPSPRPTPPAARTPPLAAAPRAWNSAPQPWCGPPSRPACSSGPVLLASRRGACSSAGKIAEFLLGASMVKDGLRC